MRHNLADRVDNTNDIIDSRDILERIEELETELSSVECGECSGSGHAPMPEDADEDAGPKPAECAHCDGRGTVSLLDREAMPEEAEHNAAFTELEKLRALVEEIEANAGDSARDGVTLIRDNYFETYARELADDIGAVNKDLSWPNNCIDWERAAEELKMDYSIVDHDGTDYWVRS